MNELFHDRRVLTGRDAALDACLLLFLKWSVELDEMMMSCGNSVNIRNIATPRCLWLPMSLTTGIITM